MIPAYLKDCERTKLTIKKKSPKYQHEQNCSGEGEKILVDI